MEASSFRTWFDFLSIDLNLLRRRNLGLWLVTYFLLLMKKVREREGERGREGKERKEVGKEREREQAREPQGKNHRKERTEMKGSEYRMGKKEKQACKIRRKGNAKGGERFQV